MTYLDDIQIAKNLFNEVIKQANGLASALQQAAPPQAGAPSSVTYLFETSVQLQEKLNRIGLEQDRC